MSATRRSAGRSLSYRSCWPRSGAISASKNLLSLSAWLLPRQSPACSRRDAPRSESATRDQRGHDDDGNKPHRNLHGRQDEDKDQQAGYADTGQFVGQKAPHATKPEQESQRYRENGEIIGVASKAPTPSVAALISYEDRLRQTSATTTAAVAATAACTVHANVSSPASVRTRPNAVCSLLQSALPPVKTACEDWPILPRNASQLSLPNANHDVTAMNWPSRSRANVSSPASVRTRPNAVCSS